MKSALLFSMSLSWLSRKPMTPPNDIPDSWPARDRAIRALVVDDESLNRRRLEDLLKRTEGVAVVGSAEDGVEAVDAIRALRPDLVFLDVQMPEKSGIDSPQSPKGRLCQGQNSRAAEPSDPTRRLSPAALRPLVTDIPLGCTPVTRIEVAISLAGATIEKWVPPGELISHGVNTAWRSRGPVPTHWQSVKCAGRSSSIAETPSVTACEMAPFASRADSRSP